MPPAMPRPSSTLLPASPWRVAMVPTSASGTPRWAPPLRPVRLSPETFGRSRTRPLPSARTTRTCAGARSRTSCSGPTCSTLQLEQPASWVATSTTATILRRRFVMGGHSPGPVKGESSRTTGANQIRRPDSGTLKTSLNLAAIPAPLGDALNGRYAFERELGRGGMATVYLAHDLKHQRPVAMKVLHAELANAIGVERFLFEIRTAARLSHPHILPLFDSDEAGGRLFYVMPYIEGGTLRDRLDRERQLPIEDAVRIGCEIAEALGYAHSRGVIHRDIKPENIMFSGGSAVVADLGI